MPYIYACFQFSLLHRPSCVAASISIYVALHPMHACSRQVPQCMHQTRRRLHGQCLRLYMLHGCANHHSGFSTPSTTLGPCDIAHVSTADTGTSEAAGVRLTYALTLLASVTSPSWATANAFSCWLTQLTKWGSTSEAAGAFSAFRPPRDQQCRRQFMLLLAVTGYKNPRSPKCMLPWHFYHALWYWCMWYRL